MKFRRVIAVMCMLMGALPTAGWADNQSPATIKIAGASEPLRGTDAAPLTTKERRAVAYGRQWANNRDKPARGKDGGVVFVFGATLPTVVCAPLYVCDLELQPGEAVNDIHVGDAVRWQISPATQGTGDAAITHVIIKPTDIGLMTNLLVITNRRAYTIKLVSQQEAWMPRVAFHYPDTDQASWGTYHRTQAQIKEERDARADAVNTGRIEATYTIYGDAPWRPVRAYVQGGKTVIIFPRTIGQADLPTLVSIADENGLFGNLFSEPTKELVNYRFVGGDRFVVDKVLDHAALISGVGRDQTKVELTREAHN